MIIQPRTRAVLNNKSISDVILPDWINCLLRYAGGSVFVLNDGESN